MDTQSVRMLAPKVVVLTIILFVCDFISATIAGVGDAAFGASRAAVIVAMLFVAAVETIVVSYAIVRSRWSGWKLVATIFVVFFGLKYFQSLIEAVVFLQVFVDIMPAEIMPNLFLQGLIVAVLFSPLAVLIHGKLRPGMEPSQPNDRLVMPVRQWAWKLAVIAIVYVIIYLAFGALVFRPLVGEAFDQYYGDIQLPVWFVPFQLLRGLVWVALALPVIRMMKGSRQETGVAVGLLLALLIGTQLFVPTAFMPESIRMAHFVELVSSQFLFGWIVVWLFHRDHESLRELYRKEAMWRFDADQAGVDPKNHLTPYGRVVFRHKERSMSRPPPILALPEEYRISIAKREGGRK